MCNGIVSFIPLVVFFLFFWRNICIVSCEYLRHMKHETKIIYHSDVKMKCFSLVVEAFLYSLATLETIWNWLFCLCVCTILLDDDHDRVL